MFPDIPEGSSIRQSEGADGPVLSWRASAEGGARWTESAFLCLWLCGWTVGGFGAVVALLSGAIADPCGFMFILAWLAGWAVGEAAAICTLWHMLRPDRAESIALGLDTFRHDPGRAPIRQPTVENESNWSFLRKQPVEVPRRELQEFVLDRVGERQRLTFDRGADRIEIGACLREPEREWLYAVLESWRRSR